MTDIDTQKYLEGEILAFDIGEKRIGVARVNTLANLPEPLHHLNVTGETQLEAVVHTIKALNPIAVVIGLPRGLEGQETAQTSVVRNFIADLKTEITAQIYWIDEAGTSKEALERIKKQKKDGDIDSVAAMIMLEDFMNYKNKQELLVV